jgi:putative ABC transport system substrate-binding protein
VRCCEFISLLRGATIAWPCIAHAAFPLTAKAQQPTTPRIGYVWVGDRATDTRGAGLRQGLADKGYVIGRDLVMEERYVHGNGAKQMHRARPNSVLSRDDHFAG